MRLTLLDANTCFVSSGTLTDVDINLNDETQSEKLWGRRIEADASVDLA